MKATNDDLREALGLSRPRGGAGREGCPSAEAIVALAEGEEAAVAERARGVLDHVAQCAGCAAEYRLASSLKPWADGAASGLRVSTATTPPVRSRSTWPRATWWPQALAASVLLVGLGGWNLTLRRQGLDLRAQLAETRSRDADAARRLAEKDSELAAMKGRQVSAPAPDVNVPIVDLDSGGARGASAAAAVLRVPPGTVWATFVLTVSGGASTEAHSLEIQSEDGRVVWRGDGLVANRFGTFTVAVPSALLPAGRFQFVLSRPARDGASRVVQTYRLVVRPPAS